MIILGWIGFLLLCLTLLAWLFKSKYETYKESFISLIKDFGISAGFIATCIGLVWLFFLLLDASGVRKERKPRVNTPTILICNNVTVAESINGFIYRDKSGTYEDYRGGLTYTPRQGEVCKEYLKGDK